jgi:anti-sigma-K factor RskA
MTHEAASELLGAYALDAVDGDEHSELEEHLATCPRCRSELDGMREVAAALGNSVEPLPEGLWSGIASKLPDRPGPEEVPPMPRLAPLRRRQSPRDADTRLRRQRTLAMTLGALAVAASAVALVLGIGWVRSNDQVTNLTAAATLNRDSYTVQAALKTPGHRVVDLTSNDKVLAQFVVVPDGRGYLVTSNLPALPADHTYQLWGIVGASPVSLGLLGPSPMHATFTMAGTVTPARLSITSEPAGGTVVPTGSIVATGTF